jgi:hypothetical protein
MLQEMFFINREQDKRASHFAIPEGKISYVNDSCFIA